MARERWRKIRRAPGYKVSSLGRVRSVPRVLPDGRGHGGQILAPYADADGYLCVTLSGETVKVHHLVLEAFHGPRPYGMEGCHGFGGLLDNRAEVLRWDTHRENLRDKTRQPERLDWNGTHHPRLTETSDTDCPAGG
jgi:hypothetical protein